MIDSIVTSAPEQPKRVEGSKRIEPGKIAAFVVALLSDARRNVSGQIFGLRNNESFLLSQPRPIRGARLRGLDAGDSRRARIPDVRERLLSLGSLRRRIRVGPRLTMAICPDLLLAHKFARVRQRYARRDAIPYAQGVGLGVDPVDLLSVLEDRLATLPTFAVTLGTPGLWIKAPEFGVDFAKPFHCEQAAEFHAGPPPEGQIVAQARLASVQDRGAGKGALVVVEREIRDAASQTVYCALRQTLLLGADGVSAGRPRRINRR